MEIELELKNYRCFPDSRPARIKISNGFNALIGVNNSGKSSLLRFFFEFRQLFTMIANSPGGLTTPFQGRPQGLGLAGVSDPNEVFHNQNERDIQIGIRVVREPDGSQPAPQLPAEIHITHLRGQQGWTAKLPGKYSEQVIPNLIVRGHSDNRATLIVPPGGPELDLSVIQRACRVLGDTLYLGPFRNVVNLGSNENYYDIKVGQAFVTEWRAKKMGRVISDNEAILRLTDEIRKIFGFEQLEINPADDNSTLKVFVNNRSYKLTEQGAGLTQFLMVLGNAAIRKASLVLIDEPEQNLHPSLQLDFLTTVASYSRLGVLFGTHSIGLARSVADRIYSLRRVAEGETELRDYEATPQLAEFVGELSYSGYRELGFGKILLVEGPKDVTTFQQFLRLYGKDHEVVILQMGGKSLITGAAEPQLLELKRICNDISAVIDSELDSKGATLDPSRLAFVEVCRRVGIDCHILERRAIENYFSASAVKKAKGENFNALSPYQKLADLSPNWSKGENWRIAREMKEDELSSSDLGRFLESL